MVSVEDLRCCELFSELTDEELGLLVPLCRERVYEAGETIFSAQETAEELYILQEGRVALQIQLRSAVERSGDVTIEEVKPGHIFGWSSVVKQQRFTATARALERTKVCAIPAGELNALFSQHTHIGFVVMKQLANVISPRLRHTRDELAKRASANA
ncbi:MAG: cyclic nucleotide-binding domain-containing protein [Anaerolineae bacterium]|nr:cyclic nucleotide-binding domain-containing protein [Anaerolineae bacterium]